MAYARASPPPVKAYVRDASVADPQGEEWDVMFSAAPRGHTKQHGGGGARPASPQAAASPGVARDSSRMRMSQLVALVARQEGAVRNGEIQMTQMRDRIESLQEEIDDRICSLMRRSEKTDESIARLQTEMRERCTKLEETQYQLRYSQTQAREYDRRPAAAGVPPSHTIFGGAAEAPAPARGGRGDAAEDEGAGGDAMRQQQQQQQQQLLSTINETVGLVHRELVTLTASMQGTRDRPDARAARAAADGGARTESLHERVSAILQRRPATRSEEVTRGRSRQSRRDEHHFHPLVSSCFVDPSSRRGSASSMRGRPGDGAGAGEGEMAGAPRREDDDGVPGQHRLRQMKSAIRKLRRGADAQR